jgi:hypothetical protein
MCVYACRFDCQCAHVRKYAREQRERKRQRDGWMEGEAGRQAGREGESERPCEQARERDSERERRDLKFMLLLNGNFVTIFILVQQPCSCHQPTLAYITHSIQHACLWYHTPSVYIIISCVRKVRVCGCVCACARVQAVYPPLSFLPYLH